MKFKLVIAVLALLPALVLAQNAPNMIGTWTGTFNATIMGSSAHHIVPKKTDKEIYFNKVPFTLVIERQEGINFSGSIASNNHKEVILGAITPDFQGGVMVDDNGRFTFKFIDPTTIQSCYTHIEKKSKVASCWIGKKQ
jgi:hypothetical protein